MKKKWRRRKSILRSLASFMLAIILITGVVPVAVFAAEYDGEDSGGTPAAVEEKVSDEPGDSGKKDGDDDDEPGDVDDVNLAVTEDEVPAEEEQQIVEMQLVSGTISANADDATVSISGLLPEGAGVSAKRANAKIDGYEVIVAYDIKIMVGDEQWQPEEPVKVTISSPKLEGIGSASVFHIKGGSAKLVGNVSVSGTAVSFTTGGFSVFAVAVKTDETKEPATGAGEPGAIEETDITDEGPDNYIDAAADEPAGPGEDEEPVLYVMNYYISGELTNTRPVNEEGFADNLPVFKSAYPANTTRFLGWYTQPDGGELFNFSAPLTGDTNVYAHFDKSFLIKYKSEAGGTGDEHVIDTKVLNASTGYGVPGTNVTPDMPGNMSNAHITHWYVEGGSPEEVFQWGTPAESDMSLVPFWSNSWWVFFESDGSAVEPKLVNNGEAVAAPAAPTRAGYEFSHWSTEPGGATAYNFDNPVTESNLVLYAVWSPQAVEYTITYWVEKPNFTGDPGDNPDNYIFYKSVEKTAIAGSTADHTSAAGLDTITVASGSYNIQWARFSHGEEKTVLGTGTTVVNVYFKRIEFTYYFNLNPGTNSTTNRNGATMVFGGATYAQGVNVSASGTAANGASVNYPNNQYSFTAKFEQDVESLWPSSANATFLKETRTRSNTNNTWGALTTNGFRAWSAGSVSNTTATSDYVTKRFTITHDMLPTSGTSVTYPAAWGSTRSVTVNYHFERLLSETGGTQKTFAGVSPDRFYIRSALHSQALLLQSNLSAKNIEGVTYVGDGASYGSTTSTYDFYYTRNRFTISFNTVGGSSIPSVTDVMFGEPLIYGGYDSAFNTVPTKAVDGIEYVFEGWYLDAEYNKPFVRAGMTMPNSNLMLYARWQANDFNVTYYDSLGAGANWLETQPIGRGETVQLEDAPYKPGDVVEGKGTFDAWYVKMGNTWSRWPAERTATGDIELHAGWKTDGFRLTYSLGSGTGVLPADSDTYWLGKQARLSYGEGIVPPEGYVFVGWKASYQGISEDDAGTIWSPGDYYPLYGSTLMTAVYVEIGRSVEIVYRSNYAGDAEGTEEIICQWVVPDAQGNVKLKGEIFERDDAILQRWDTERDGTGVSHGLGTTMAAPGETLYLYGIWLDNVYTITFNASNNGTLELDGAQNKQFAYHGIRGGSNWGSEVGAAGGVPTPAANDGYAFKEWRSGSITGAAVDMDAEAARTVNGNLQYWAIFEPLYTVTYHGNGSTYGAVPNDGNNPYFAGDSVTVLGQGELWKSNWTFAGWNTKPDGSGVSYNGGDTFTMPAGNVNLYAQWQVAIDVEIVANSNIAIYDGTGHTASGYTYIVRTATTDGSKGAVLGGFAVEAVTSDPVSVNVTAPPLPNDIDRDRVVVKYNDADVTTLGNVTLRSVSYIDGELTVKPRPLVITAGSESKVYDGTPLTFAGRELTGGMYEISGLTPLAEGHEINSLTFSGSQTDPGSSGNTAYGAVITAADGINVTANYEIEYIPGVLVVTTSAEEVILAAASAEKVYDGIALSNPALDDAKTFLPAGITRVEAVVEGAQTDANTTGGNNIIASYRLFSGNTDVTEIYTEVTLVPGNLIVTPRPVVITAASASKIYDGTALTNSNSSWSNIEGNDDSGLVDGHSYTVAVDGSQLDAGSSGNAASGAVITDAGGNDVTGNYGITYVNGTLTVYAGSIYVHIPYTKVYGDPDPSIGSAVNAALQAEVNAQLTAQGLQAGDINVTVSGRESGEDVGGSPYRYEVTWTITDNGEFITGEISIGADLTITPKTIRITAHPKMKMYGNPDPAFTVRPITGLAGDDIIEYELYRENKSEDVGVYFINAEIDRDKYPNYLIEYVGNWLTITPRPVVLVAQDVTIRVGDPLPEHPDLPHYVSSYFPLAEWDEGLAYELYTTAEDSSVAGEFPIRFMLDRNDPLNRNYIIYVVPATLYIIDETSPTPTPPPPPPPPPGEAAEDPTPPPSDDDADGDTDGDDDGDGDTVIPEDPDPVPEGMPPPAFTIPGMPLPLAEQPVIETLGRDIPLGMIRVAEPAWALWNLILTLSGVMLAIAMGIRAFGKKEDDEATSMEPPADNETKYRKKNLVLCLAIPVIAVLACILFIVTQDINSPMTLVDKWTAAHAALFTGGLMCFIFADRKDKDKEEEKEASA